MTVLNDGPRWLERIRTIPQAFDEVRFPQLDGYCPTQDREWCELVVDGQARRVRFHDYHQVYQVPGFYEELFYELLKCCSPSRVVSMLLDMMGDYDESPEQLGVLDVGAGNGMVGDELKACGARKLVGIDIIPEARDAALRDRPDVYDDYMVADLTDLSEEQEKHLRRQNFNCLTTVAALGFGDIPAGAFAKALDMIEQPGWVAFNIKEEFLAEKDNSGFCDLIRRLACEEIVQMQAYRRYRHRISVTGEPLFYVSMIMRKLRDVPGEMLDDLGV